MNAHKIKNALDSAIKAHQELAVVGNFSTRLDDGDDYLFLIWECEEKDWNSDWYGDEPWTKEGGNKIIESSGVGEPNDSGIDYYTDKYGDAVIQHWVKYQVKEEE